MRHTELTFKITDDGALYSPTLFKLFNVDKNLVVTSNPIVKLRPEMRIGQDADGAYIWVKDRHLTETIQEPHEFDDDEYPLEMYLRLDNQEIRHLHSFLGAILNDKMNCS